MRHDDHMPLAPFRDRALCRALAARVLLNATRVPASRS